MFLFWSENRSQNPSVSFSTLLIYLLSMPMEKTFLILLSVVQGCIFQCFVWHLESKIAGWLPTQFCRSSAGDEGDDEYSGISNVLSLFVDDISSCIYLPDFEFICQQVRSRGTSIGCFVNPHKTIILTSCNGTSIQAALAQHNPSLLEPLQKTTTQSVTNVTKVQWVFWREGTTTSFPTKRNKPSW